MRERTKFLLIAAVFLVAYYVPFDHPTVRRAGVEALLMLQEYAQKHVLFCLVPAFFIAGAIAVFVSQAAVMKYFGAQAKKILAYSVASVSGTILAVCSCTVLPLFAGLYKRGAGIGPATAFLYSGPAINVLAIILTARILGWQMGLARAVGAVVFAFIIGLLMALIFHKEEVSRTQSSPTVMPEVEEEERPLWKNGLCFLAIVLILIFAAWGRPSHPVGFWNAVYVVHWYLSGALLIMLGIMLWRWFHRDELSDWVSSTWRFSNVYIALVVAMATATGLLFGTLY